jgi:hypothetical protein
VVIEAKITEDDGAARDKVTRIQHLGELSISGMPPGQQKYQVIAGIAGRGFGVRREDMKKCSSPPGEKFSLSRLCLAWWNARTSPDSQRRSNNERPLT